MSPEVTIVNLTFHRRWSGPDDMDSFVNRVVNVTDNIKTNGGVADMMANAVQTMKTADTQAATL